MLRRRKAAVMLAFDTHSPQADAIPLRIVQLVKINARFPIKAWRSNDGSWATAPAKEGFGPTSCGRARMSARRSSPGYPGTVRDRQSVLH